MNTRLQGSPETPLLMNDTKQTANSPDAYGSPPEAKISTAAPERGTEKLTGNFEILSSTLIQGWSWNQEQPDSSVNLELWVDGSKYCCFAADKFRADLRKSGIGNGCHAFWLDIPKPFLNGVQHTFEIRSAATGKNIPNSPRTVITNISDGSLINCSIFWDQVILKDSCLGTNFEATVLQHKKVVIFCSYTPDGMRYGYHDYLQQAFTAAGYVCLLVNSTPEGGVTKESCFKSTDYYIIKRNEGYDFGSWIVGLYKIIPYLDQLEELVLINDSVFGPLFDINSLFERMRNSPCDFWGIIDSYEHSYHLQSFFLCAKRRILQERALADFISQYLFPSDKSAAIEQGEIGISRFLIARGYVPEAVFPSRELASTWLGRIEPYVRKISAFDENRFLNTEYAVFPQKPAMTEAAQFISSVSRNIRLGVPVNPMHFFWDILLEAKCPFIKRELLFKNVINHPFHFEIMDTIKSRSEYPLEYIYECAVRYGTERIV